MKIKSSYTERITATLRKVKIQTAVHFFGYEGRSSNKDFLRAETYFYNTQNTKRQNHFKQVKLPLDYRVCNFVIQERISYIKY